MPGIDTTTTYNSYPQYTTGLSGSPFFDWLLRNQIVPMVIDARNNEVPFLGALYKRKKSVAGRFIIQPVRDGRNYAGISAIHPEGDLPDPGRQGAYNYALGVKDIYARAKFSGKMLRATSMADARFADYLEYEIGGLKDDIAIKQEIMLHGDGSGKRAEWASQTATLITVRHNQDIAGVANISTAPSINLDIGMRIAFVTSAGTVRASAGGSSPTPAAQAVYIVGKTGTNQISVSYTLGGAAISDLTTAFATLTAGDWIVDASRDSSMTSTAYVDTGFKGEPMGIEGVMRTTGVLDGMAISTAGQQTGAQDFTGLTSTTAAGTGFQGLPVNSSFTTYTVPTWNAAIVADGGGAIRNLDDLLLQRALSDSRRINNAVVKELWSSHDMYDSYVGTLFGDKRFNTNTLAGGHSGDTKEVGGVGFNGLTWRKSRYMLGNHILGLDPDMFSIYENEPLTVCAPPGNPQYERLHDKDQFWMSLVTSYNLFTEIRNRTGFNLVDVQ